MYAYCQAERSSRKIEERCRTDAAFRVATGNLVPDHSTICRFRAAAACQGGPLEDLFTQVLFVLAAAGLGRLDVICVDGSKIWADASKQANRTEAGLRKLARKILDEAARADGEGCACAGHEHGEAAGLAGADSCGCCDGGTLPGLGLDGPAVPRGGWGGAPRAQRIAAGLAGLQAARLRGGAAARGRASVPGRGPRRGAPRGGVPADIAVRSRSCGWSRPWPPAQTEAPPGEQAAAARAPRAGASASARRSARPAGSSPPRSPQGGRGAADRDAGREEKKPPQPVRNITDPDSRVMHCTLRGPVQAYNCQVPRTGDGVFLLPRATQDTNDAAQVIPALEAIARQPGGHRRRARRRRPAPASGPASAPSCSTPATSAKTTARPPARTGSSAPAAAGRTPPRSTPPAATTTTPATRWPITCPPARAATSTAAAPPSPKAASPSSRTPSACAASPCAACPKPGRAPPRLPRRQHPPPVPPHPPGITPRGHLTARATPAQTTEPGKHDKHPSTQARPHQHQAQPAP